MAHYWLSLRISGGLRIWYTHYRRIFNRYLWISISYTLLADSTCY